MKRSRALDEIEEEAGIPYEQTALARKAVQSRKRLTLLLLIGAGVLVIESAAGRGGLALALALGVGLAAWGVHRGRLGGLVAAAFAALLAVLVPLGLVVLGTPDTPDLFSMLVSFVLGVGALPDVLTLIRDAELQHAYGLWARRE